MGKSGLYWKMEYIPKLTDKEIEENHKIFSERASLYKKKGLDFAEERKFILERVFPLEGNILEVGTGTGHTTLALAKAGYEFISIDKDIEALKTAALNLAYEKVLSRVRFYVMDGKSLTFADSSFKNIVVVNLFHHVSVVDKMLSEINRVLCNGGKAVLADFSRKGMEIIAAVHREEGRTHEHSGVTKDYVHSYFRNLGYKIQGYDGAYEWVLIAEKKAKE